MAKIRDQARAELMRGVIGMTVLNLASKAFYSEKPLFNDKRTVAVFRLNAYSEINGPE